MKIVEKIKMKDISTLDWDLIQTSLNGKGYILLKNILSDNECELLKDLYAKEEAYRSTINMERYRFGKGEYKYYKYPLPYIIELLRKSFYLRLSEVANQWMSNLNMDIKFPTGHNDLIEHCHRKNQSRPTPLILRYEKGGYNTLHQDLYGEVYFPFQIVFPLSKREVDFTGGDFVLVEQIPRAQSKAKVIQPDKGDAVIFTTNFRPVKGTRGYYRATVKHGLSEVESGERYAMGIIFHDAS
jgi:hypothetical protein